MCGRYALTAEPEAIRRTFGYIDHPNFPARYNIAPTQPIGLVIRAEGQRRFLLVRWGFIPGWVKDPRDFSLLINARAETAAEKPAFRAAMRHRRALVPASGFYEWRKTPDGGKQPYWIRPRDGAPVAFAGLWETWASADGSEIDTGAILTVPANRTLSPIHDRMPAVVHPSEFERWLDTVATDARAATAMLRPAAEDFFEAVPVSTRVNAVRNDDEGLQAPLSEPLATATDADTKPPSRPAAKTRKREGGDDGQQSLF